MDISIDDVIKFSITPKMDVDNAKNGHIVKKKTFNFLGILRVKI